MSILVLPDLEAISHKAAEIFLDFSERAIVRKGFFTVAVSGGSTPRGLYELLGSEPLRNRADWSRVHFFWIDERCVPINDERSNFKLVFNMLLSKSPVPRINIHRIKGEKGPERGAVEYEKEIKTFFGTSGVPVFDLILLGMGKDGHTASLFPGSEALTKTEKLVVPVFMDQPQIHRITMTLPVLNNAVQILFLVAGKAKASTLKMVLTDKERKKQYPAGLVRPVHGTILWLIDQEAAGLFMQRI
jgi:6-phosphogluconolactonase